MLERKIFILFGVLSLWAIGWTALGQPNSVYRCANAYAMDIYTDRYGTYNVCAFVEQRFEPRGTWTVYLNVHDYEDTGYKLYYATLDAARIWNAFFQRYGLPFTFEVRFSYGIGIFLTNNKKIDISWSPLFSLFWEKGWLAVASRYSYFYTQNGAYYYETDIDVDSYEDWNPSKLKETLVHELGHVLGLPDLYSDPKYQHLAYFTVMQSYGMHAKEPTEWDAAMLCAAYGCTYSFSPSPPSRYSYTRVSNFDLDKSCYIDLDEVLFAADLYNSGRISEYLFQKVIDAWVSMTNVCLYGYSLKQDILAQVYDLSGRKLFEIQAPSERLALMRVQRILANGVYLVILKGEQRLKVKKIAVLR